MATNNYISVTYADAEMRNLVEEYITQQKAEFTLKGACAYIFYWAIEDGKVSDTENLIEAKELQQADKNRVNRIIDSIVTDGRIVSTCVGYRKL